MKHLISKLNISYRFLAKQNDLSPSNPVVLETISELEALLKRCVLTGIYEEILTAQETADLRQNLPRIYAMAKCELEKHYARQFLNNKYALTEISDFYYYTNYIHLLREEFSIIPLIPSRIVFLGCGALPLTAIIIAKRYHQVEVLCVDADGEACDLADNLVRIFRLNRNIKIFQSSANRFSDKNSNAVISAALLSGCNVFDTPAAKETPYLLFRHGTGIISILYDNISRTNDNFRLIASTSSNRVNINSTSLYINLGVDTL